MPVISRGRQRDRFAHEPEMDNEDTSPFADIFGFVDQSLYSRDC